MARAVEIIAPSRFHFGLLSFGNSNGRQFGGVGVMITEPALKLRLTCSDRLEATGPSADRALQFAKRWHHWAQEYSGPYKLGCHLEILTAPLQHSGLGSGTQLALSVAAGLNALFDMSKQVPEQLAASVGRGERSAVGSYGFVMGGLLVEAGKLMDEPFSPLVARVALPEEWRFLLILSPHEQGLHGSTEREAFASLPPVPDEITRSLSQEILVHMLPAAKHKDFSRFSRSLYRYGHAAGLCFAQRQHGAFANPYIAQLVSTMREHGIEGVGQSSWGPTVFALLPNAAAADELSRLLRPRIDERSQVLVVEPNNCGAAIHIVE